jgi:hypothetical protein
MESKINHSTINSKENGEIFLFMTIFFVIYNSVSKAAIEFIELKNIWQKVEITAIWVITVLIPVWVCFRFDRLGIVTPQYLGDKIKLSLFLFSIQFINSKP